MSDVTLNLIQLAYQLPDEEPAVCTPKNRSFLAWDETRGRRKWPTKDEAPFLFQTFLVWHELNRSGKTALTFDQFKEACIGVEVYDSDPDKDTDDPTYGQVPVDPTQPEATPDLSSP